MKWPEKMAFLKFVRENGFFVFVKRMKRKLGLGGSVLALFVASMVLQAVPARAADCVGYTTGEAWVIAATQSGCAIPHGTYTPSSFTIEASTTVYAQGNTGTGTGVVIDATGDISIEGTFSADGYGYPGATSTIIMGPGTPQKTLNGNSGGAGGGYGGNGGIDPYDTVLGGQAYGSVTEPSSIGSGGGYSTSGGNGRDGGGAIKLSTPGTITLNGTVTADGGTSGAAGGSGGSVWLDAGTLAGSGTITAVGSTVGCCNNPGGGGGGRVAIYYTNGNPSSYTIQAYGGNAGAEKGGAGTVYTKSSTQTNGSLILDNGSITGTIASTPLLNSGETYDVISISDGAEYHIPSGLTLTLASGGTLTGSGTDNSIIIEDGGTFDPTDASFTLSGVDIGNYGNISSVANLTIGPDSTLTNDADALLRGEIGLTSLIVGNGGSGTMVFNGSSTLSVPTVTVASGGLMKHVDNSSSHVNSLMLSSTDIDIQSGGSVDVDGLGFDGADYGVTYGPGTPERTLNNNSGGGGGGYGGNGGDDGAETIDGGTTYGSVTQPSSIGSGGGYSTNGFKGRSGGGAIKLIASGTLTVDGTISSDGSTSSGAAGGSGGSVWISAGTLAGTGSVTANGGTVGCCNSPGGGGGGRIAVYYTNDNSNLISTDGKIQAYGGSGGDRGGAGTIYLKQASATYGDLVVSNGDNYSAADDEVTTQVEAALTVDNLTVEKNAKYVIPSGSTLTVPSSGTLTTGGTRQPSITVDSGGTFNPPSSGSYTFTSIDVVNNGTVNNISNLTLSDSTFTHDGALGSTLTDLTCGSSGTFVLGGTGNVDLANMTLNSGGTFSQASGFDQLAVDNVTVNSGGNITHPYNGTTEQYVLNIAATDFTVNSGGYVNVDGNGYAGATSSTVYGPGTPAKTLNGNSGGAGGGYGGNGGRDGALTVDGGATYGSVTEPASIGSGGGYSTNGGTGRAGGGAVKIVVSDTLTLEGTITADGGSSGSTGGSGGAVWIQAGTLAGSGGAITANGSASLGCCNSPGGGGGGRISINYTNGDTSGYTLEAFGTNSGNYKGGAGTIFTKSAAQTNGTLLVDNNSATGTVSTTNQVGSSETYDSVVISNSSYYHVVNGTTLAYASGGSVSGNSTGSLTVDDGGNLSGPSGSFDFTGLTVQNNSDLSLFSLNVGSSGNFIQSSTKTLFSSFVVSDLTIESGGTFTQEGTATITPDNLDVQSGGTLTHADNSTTQANILNFSVTTATIAGTVNVSYLGYDSSEGTGAGSDGSYGSGGAHCGYGGAANSGTPARNTATYGDASNPLTIGSGGGDDNGAGGQQGGMGGGAVSLSVSGTLTVTGAIYASGRSAHVISNSYQGGGGAGGSINLTAGTFAGDGTISANGGDGSPYTSSSAGGGGGGAGYIYIGYTTSTWTGTTEAVGGPGGGPGGSSTAEAGETCTPVLQANAPTVDSSDEDSESGNETPFANESTVITVNASYDGGVSRVELYLDGQTTSDYVGGCSYSPAATPVVCSVDAGVLSQGYHTKYVKVFGADGTEVTDESTLRVAGETPNGRAILSTHQKSATEVDFTLSFTLVATQPSGTLTVNFPAGFTVTRGATTAGSSNCLSEFNWGPSTLTATKTDCSGTVLLAGAQVTNPSAAGAYTINWSNDNGWADVIIVDSGDLLINGTVDPLISFLAVAQPAASTCAPSEDLSGSDYALDLGALNVSTLTESESANADSGTVERVCMQGSTHAASGMAVTVKSANGSSGLVSASVPADGIASSTTGQIAAGTPGYGVCLISASLASDGGLTPASADPTATGDFSTHGCSAAAGNVVALDGTSQSLWSASGPTSDSTANLWVRVAISATQPAHNDYTDSLTFIATATY